MVTSLIPTGTSNLGDSLDVVVASARLQQEYAFGVPQLCDRRMLEPGTGRDWKEALVARLTASRVSETADLQNIQQYSDSAFTIRPAGIGIATAISWKAAQRISPISLAVVGSAAMNAINRLLDVDGIAMFPGFSNNQPNASATLTIGHISAAASNIKSNTTEPWTGPIATVLQGFQGHDLFGDIVAGVGTYIVGDGLTAQVLAQGYTGQVINTSRIYYDDNITIDANTRATGATFASGPGGAIVLVEDGVLRIHPEFRPSLAGGSTVLYMYKDYAYGERRDVWGRGHTSDATAPTS